jgi:predicted dehydrogenase
MINVALFGAGFVSGNHAAAYDKLPGTKLVAVLDADGERAEKLAGPRGARAYTEAETLFAKENVDLVDVCLPTFLHEKYVVMAAEKGKQVLCEKPFALTGEAADRMIAAAEKSKVRLMVAQVLRFWPEYVEIKRRLDRGDLGELQMVYANRLAQHPNWSEWFKDPEKSGGGLFDLHLHDIDVLRYFFGPVETVYALGYKTPGGCYNHVMSSLKFRNGARAVAEGAFQMSEGYPFTMTFRAVGTKGTLEFVLSAGFNLENLGGASSRLVLFENGRKPEIVEVDGTDAYFREIEYFTDCIARGLEHTVVPARESREVLDIAFALRESMETGEVRRL